MCLSAKSHAKTNKHSFIRPRTAPGTVNWRYAASRSFDAREISSPETSLEHIAMDSQNVGRGDQRGKADHPTTPMILWSRHCQSLRRRLLKELLIKSHKSHSEKL